LIGASITKNLVIGTGGFRQISKNMAPVAARVINDLK
jgi:hypothetical protein